LSIQYKELLQNISDWLFETDNKNSFTYCSQSILQTLGYDSKELIGKTPFHFMNDEEAKKFTEIFALHTLNKEPIVDFQTTFIHKDTRKITVMINAIPILNENGDVVNFQGLIKETTIFTERLELSLKGTNDVQGTWKSINEHLNSQTKYYEGIHHLNHRDGHWAWILDEGKATRLIGTHTDITEEKAMQLKSRHQKQIIEQIHDSVISTDLNGIITSWNSGSELLLGYTAKEVIGKHVSLIYLDDDLELMNANIYLLLKNGGHNIEAHMITKTKEVLLVDLSLSVLKDEKSNPTGLIGYARDITQKRKAEDMLEQQSKMAQMGEMISMIAHQWRQPLNAISLTALNLKLKFDFDEYDSKTQEDFHQCTQDFSQGLEKIEDYVITLSSTIDDFRNFFSKDKVSVSIKLEDIVPKALNIIFPSLNSNQITVIEEYNSSKEIEVYENEIIQVILTLLQNAQENFLEKKTEEPYIKIIVKNRMISICDNGGGVPKNIINRIFDPYFSTKLQKNGSGLGLYMSKTIIEKHHKGKLTVKNRNDGTCFTIKIL